MEINKLKENIRILQMKIENNQFSKIDLSQVTYEELVNLLHKFYKNKIIFDKIIFCSSLKKYTEQEIGTNKCSLQLFLLLRKILSDDSIIENDIYKIYEILNSQIEGLDIVSLQIFIDEIIDLYLKNRDMEDIYPLINDLISKYFSLNLLSKKMILFYINDAVREDNTEDCIRKITFKKEKNNVASFTSFNKTLNFDYNVLGEYFKNKSITTINLKNRILLQIIEHELDHLFMNKVRSSYNILSPTYKEQMKIKEFNYFINSLKCDFIIRLYDFPISLNNIYSEYRANTFGYLKSMKRIRKKYSRFLQNDLENRMFENTFLNIINFYTYKGKTPYEIQNEIFHKFYKNQYQTEYTEEFIPESFEQTKELFEELFDEEFSEEVLSELHRIMIGEQTLKNYELKENLQEMTGDELIETIINKK